MNPIAFQLGNLKIYWYSIFILIGAIIAIFFFLRSAKKEKIEEEFSINLLFYGIIIGIIGARLYYCLFNLDYYLANPLNIIKIWEGGLAIHGGIIAGGLWFIYYSKKHHKNVWQILDFASISIIIAQAIGRWGNFFNQEAHGIVTTKEALRDLFIPNFVIEGMNINGIYYYPTFYFEFLWNLLGFVVLLILKKKKVKTGKIFGVYLMWYSFARFFIEGMRTDSLWLGPIRVAQLMSLILFIAGLVIIILRSRKEDKTNAR